MRFLVFGEYLISEQTIPRNFLQKNKVVEEATPQIKMLGCVETWWQEWSKKDFLSEQLVSVGGMKKEKYDSFQMINEKFKSKLLQRWRGLFKSIPSDRGQRVCESGSRIDPSRSQCSHESSVGAETITARNCLRSNQCTVQAARHEFCSSLRSKFSVMSLLHSALKSKGGQQLSLSVPLSLEAKTGNIRLDSTYI